MKKILFVLVILISFSLTAQWSYVGSSNGFAEDGVNYPQLRFHPNTNEPYVFFLDFLQNVGTGPTMVRFDGSNWITIGDRRFDNSVPLLPFNYGFDFNKTNNRPIVFYGDPRHVKDYDGISWNELEGTNTITIGDFFFASSSGFGFAVNPLTGSPTVAFSDTSGTTNFGLATVVSFSNNEWGFLDIPKFSPEVSTYFDITYNSINGAPYLLHGGGANGDIAVYEFDGIMWNNLGITNFVNQNNERAKIRINQNNGDIFIANNANINGQPTIEIKKWDGANWIDLVTDITQIHAQSRFDFEIHPTTGEVYLLYLDRNNTPSNPNLTVARYDGSNWVPLGTETITGSVDHFNIRFQPTSGVPYVAYGGGSGGWIKKYEGILGIDDAKLIEGVFLYPNPATLITRFSENIQSYKIFDVNGKEITNGIGREINLINLSQGLYFVQGFDELGNSITKKLLKI